jgi:hypothetical protein
MQHRPKPSFAPERERTLLRREKPGFLLKHFRKPFWAFIWSFALLMFAGVVYLVVHLIAPATSFDPREALQFEPGASLRPIYSMALLERFCSKASIAQISERLEQKRQFLSGSLLRQRRAALSPVMGLNQAALLWEGTPPAILGLSPDKATDEDFATADLGSMLLWLSNRVDTLKEPGNRRAFLTAIEGLKESAARETRYQDELLREMDGLLPNLSFGWLYTESGWWVFEVLFWSFAGVLANTIIGLILACRARTYNAEEFTLILPKIFLAPALAIVFVALWTTGFSEAQITYLNLPYFLVFSFLLGFATESLYTKLRDLVGLVVTPSATVSEPRLRAAAADVPYPWIHKLEEARARPAPASLQALEAKATAVALATAERATVAAAAQQPEET